MKQTRSVSYDPGRVEGNVADQISTTLLHQRDALAHLIYHIPENCTELIDMLLSGTGRVIFSGIGKSGHIARKLAATYSSVSIPSIYMHPVEALHGDVGFVCARDIVIILSKSGYGEEFALLVPLLKKIGVTVVLFSCQETELSAKVDLQVLIPCRQEAPPVTVAPTTSALLMLALGDAIALTVAQRKGFTSDDFALRHPAGALGKRLLLSVADLMRGAGLPFLVKDDTFEKILETITRGNMGIGVVLDADSRLQGVITDGDLRRACKKGVGVFSLKAQNIMTGSPHTIMPQVQAVDGLTLMREQNITSLIVTNEAQQVIGILRMSDIIRAGIQ